MLEQIYELAPNCVVAARSSSIKKSSKSKPAQQLELWPVMIVTKQTPLQPQELQLIATAPDVNLVCKQLKLTQRPSIPLEILRAYESLYNPADLNSWGQSTRNRALHRLATQANRSGFIQRQSSSWGSQYSAVVNFWLVAQPKYRRAEWIPHLQPLFHPDLWTAVNCYDPKLQLDHDHLQRLRAAVIQHHNKPAQSIYRPHIANHHNLVDLNWVALLELWVCVPELQHPNHLTEFLYNHQPLKPTTLGL